MERGWEGIERERKCKEDNICTKANNMGNERSMCRTFNRE